MSTESFYFNPSARDVAVFLGPTEARLMELAWEKQSLTVKKALFFLESESKPQYTTVMTVLGRLADKGLLKKKKQGRLFVYRPTVSKEEFLRQRVKVVTNALKQFK